MCFNCTTTETEESMLPAIAECEARDQVAITSFWRDICCNGGNPQHCKFKVVLPDLDGGTKKDAFHLCQPVIHSTGGAACGTENLVASRELGQAVLPWIWANAYQHPEVGSNGRPWEPTRESDLGRPFPGSVDQLIHYLMKCTCGDCKALGLNNTGTRYDFVGAIAKFKESSHFQKFAQRREGTVAQQVERVRAWHNKFSYRERPDYEGPPYWKKETTARAHNLEEHASKGCFNSPWTDTGMKDDKWTLGTSYSELPTCKESGLTPWRYKGSTGALESGNRISRHVVHEISRCSEKTAQPMLLLQFVRLNFTLDVTLGKTNPATKLPYTTDDATVRLHKILAKPFNGALLRAAVGAAGGAVEQDGGVVAVGGAAAGSAAAGDVAAGSAVVGDAAAVEPPVPFGWDYWHSERAKTLVAHWSRKVRERDEAISSQSATQPQSITAPQKRQRIELQQQSNDDAMRAAAANIGAQLAITANARRAAAAAAAAAAAMGDAAIQTLVCVDNL